MLPDDSGGVIVRTVGEDVTPETIERELTTLMNTWKRIKKKTHFVRPPALVHRETSAHARPHPRHLQRQGRAHHGRLEAGLQRDHRVPEGDRARSSWSGSKLYEDTTPLFDKAEIETEIRDLFKRRCDLPSGGYLIIEPTEALVSIDVNSGRFVGKKDPEKTILKTNIEAAREIARQLRLRDVGGIIVCDFIDMETKANRDKVLQELRTHLGRDRARTKAFAVSRSRPDRDDAPARAAEPPAEHDRGVPDLSRHGPRLHGGDDRPAHGAQREAHGRRGASATRCS